MKKLFARFGLVIFLQVAFVFGLSAQSSVTSSTALQHYLHNDDQHYHWELKDSFTVGSVKGYDLFLVSQKWRQYVWKHQLTIFSPEENDYDGALLIITGGHNDKITQSPHWKKGSKGGMWVKLGARTAEKNKAIVAVVRQIPNEPLFDSLTEDQIISYTFHQFNDTKDYSWPLLFPMVKGAVKAMDALQEFSNQKLFHPLNRFVVTGASKRGWTTWLTGANDSRVVAIAPMVIDILNMPVNLKHQMDAYGSYSKQINDYVKLGIVQGMGTPEGETLVDMVDPYSYREKLTMPKLIFMGTNDPYWVIDNVKNYLPQIPGYNLLNYTPNAGHDLNKGTVAFPALSAFFGITMAHGNYPECSWETKESRKKVTLTIRASKDMLVGVKLWSADSKDMDFRDEKWSGQDLGVSHKSEITTTVDFPSSGYRSFYVSLKYRDPNGGEYTISTRAFMTDTKEIL